MMLLLRTRFLEDAYNDLDSKYTNLLEGSFNRAFLHANFLEMLNYYNLLSFRAQKYRMNDYMISQKLQLGIALFIKKSKESNYDPDIICMLYGFICSIIFNRYIKEYLQANSKKVLPFAKKVEKEWFTYHKIDMVKPYVKYKNNFKLSSDEEEVYDDFFKKVMFNSNGLLLLKYSLDNLFKAYKIEKRFLSYTKVNFKLCRVTNRKAIKLKYLYPAKKVSKRPTLNLEFNAWYSPSAKSDVRFSFTDLYYQALEDAKMIINATNDIIFYNQDKGWKVINEYQKQLSNQ